MHTLRDVETAFNEGKVTLVDALQKAYELGGEAFAEIVKSYTVVITEGEKDADRVTRLELLGSTPYNQTEGLNGRGTTWL